MYAPINCLFFTFYLLSLFWLFHVFKLNCSHILKSGLTWQNKNYVALHLYTGIKHFAFCGVGNLVKPIIFDYNII